MTAVERAAQLRKLQEESKEKYRARIITEMERRIGAKTLKGEHSTSIDVEEATQLCGFKISYSDLKEIIHDKYDPLKYYIHYVSYRIPCVNVCWSPDIVPYDRHAPPY